jgi:hypothetical protein
MQPYQYHKILLLIFVTKIACGDRMRRLREFYCVSNCIGLSSPDSEEGSGMLAGRTRAVNVGFNCSNQEFSVRGSSLLIAYLISLHFKGAQSGCLLSELPFIDPF